MPFAQALELRAPHTPEIPNNQQMLLRVGPFFCFSPPGQPDATPELLAQEYGHERKFNNAKRKYPTQVYATHIERIGRLWAVSNFWGYPFHDDPNFEIAARRQTITSFQEFVGPFYRVIDLQGGRIMSIPYQTPNHSLKVA